MSQHPWHTDMWGVSYSPGNSLSGKCSTIVILFLRALSCFVTISEEFKSPPFSLPMQQHVCHATSYYIRLFQGRSPLPLRHSRGITLIPRQAWDSKQHILDWALVNSHASNCGAGCLDMCNHMECVIQLDVMREQFNRSVKPSNESQFY